MPCPAVALDKIKLDLTDSNTLSGDLEHLLKHFCPNSKVPELLKKRNRNGSSMSVFHSGSKRDLTVSGNLPVHNAGNHHSILIVVIFIYKGFFLFKADPSPFLRILHQKICLTRCFYYESEHFLCIIFVRTAKHCNSSIF